jgi:hypothetical protein
VYAGIEPEGFLFGAATSEQEMWNVASVCCHHRHGSRFEETRDQSKSLELVMRGREGVGGVVGGDKNIGALTILRARANRTEQNRVKYCCRCLFSWWTEQKADNYIERDQVLGEATGPGATQPKWHLASLSIGLSTSRRPV